MARVARWVSVSLAAAIATAATPAYASDWLYNVTGAGFVSWSDNILNAPPPGEDPLGGPGAEEDVYTEIRPGILAAYETPRAVHNLVGEVIATIYAQHSEANSLQGRLGHAGLFLLSGATEIITQSFLAFGETNQFATGRPTDAGAIGLVPSGSQRFIELSVQDVLNHQYKPEWRLTQAGQIRIVGTRANAMDNDTTSIGYDLVGGGGATRVWQDDAVSAEVVLSNALYYSSFGDSSSTSTQFNGALISSWVHNISEGWSTRLFGGVSSILLLGNQTQTVTSPTGGVAAGWSSGWGALRASASRSTGAELFIAQSAITDVASASGWLLLYQFEADSPYDDPSSIGLAGSASASRYALYDNETGDHAGDSEGRMADAALSWQNSAYGMSVRYTWIDQDVDEAVQRSSLLPYERTSVMVTIFGRWPEKVGPVVPQRDPLRVQTDEQKSEEERRVAPRDGTPGGF